MAKRIKTVNTNLKFALKKAPPKDAGVKIRGVVERTNKYGLFVVNADGKRFGFTLDKVRHYAGQNPSKVGLNVGDQVSLRVQNDRVQAADTKVLAADAFH
jgi:hypothetical protein